MRPSEITASRTRASVAKLSFSILIALSFCFAFGAGVARADKKPAYGRINVSTTPGGFPLLIDGKPAGDTTVQARLLDLPPGPHTVEIIFSNGNRWVREFNVVAGRQNCISLNYRARAVVAPSLPCPYPVNVSAPSSVNEGDTITFASDVAYSGSSALTYTWTVSPPSARIISGAGTQTITVDTTGLGKQNVTAILVVDDGSGESTCRQTAQAVTNIIGITPPPVMARKVDEWPSIAYDDDKARFDNFAIELQSNPDAQGYVIAYSGRTSRAGQAERLSDRARSYLTQMRGVDSNRLVIVNGGYRDADTYELWVVPQGAQAPQPSPTVSPSEARPSGGGAPARRRGRRR
ncbi:MAG TPA: hypothetical protein VGC66_13975 [Pyrinomonadaceae bacterium]|jgi:hypothetical protein